MFGSTVLLAAAENFLQKNLYILKKAGYNKRVLKCVCSSVG